LYIWPAAIADAAGSNANPSRVQVVCPSSWHLLVMLNEMSLLIFLRESIAGLKLKKSLRQTVRVKCPVRQGLLVNSFNYFQLPRLV